MSLLHAGQKPAWGEGARAGGASREHFLPASASRCDGQRGDGEAEMLCQAPSSRGRGRAAVGAAVRWFACGGRAQEAQQQAQ